MPSALADEDEDAGRLVGEVRLVVDEHDAGVEDDELALGDPALADRGVFQRQRAGAAAPQPSRTPRRHTKAPGRDPLRSGSPTCTSPRDSGTTGEHPGADEARFNALLHHPEERPNLA